MNFPSLQINSKFIAVDQTRIYFIDDYSLKSCLQSVSSFTSAADIMKILSFSNPKAIAVNNNNLYIVDGNEIKIYTKDYELIQTMTLTSVNVITVNNTRLYVVNDNKVNIYNIVDGKVPTPITPTMTIDVIDFKGITATNSKIYIIDGTTIKQYNTDGTNPETKIFSLSTPKGIAAEATDSLKFLYIIDGAKLLQYDDTFTLLSTNECVSPKSIAVNTKRVFLIDGTEVKRFIFTYNVLTTNLASNSNLIGTVDQGIIPNQYIINNNTVQFISSGTVTNTPITVDNARAIALNNDNLYVVGNNRVTIYDKRTYAFKTTIDLIFFKGITVNNHYLYLVDRETISGNLVDRVKIFTINGVTTGFSTITVANYKGISVSGGAVANARLFILDGKTIYLYSLTGDVRNSIISDESLSDPKSLAVNPGGNIFQIVDGSDIRTYDINSNLSSINHNINPIGIINPSGTTYVLKDTGFTLGYSVINVPLLISLKNSPIIASNNTSIFLLNGDKLTKYDDATPKEFTTLPNAKSLYVTDTHVYLGNFDTVKRYDLDGTNSLTIITGVINLNKIVVDGSILFVMNGSKLIQFETETTTIQPLKPINGTQLLTELTNINDIDLNNTYYYIIDGNTVNIINKATLTTTGTIPVNDLKNITATNTKLYIVDGATITEYDTNGSNKKVIAGLTSPTDIALLPNNKYVIDGSDVVTIKIANGVSYNYVNTNATVTDFDNSSEKVTIASIIDSKPVTSIANNAFMGKMLKEIEIPSSVTLIGNFAISGCPQLEKVTIQ